MLRKQVPLTLEATETMRGAHCILSRSKTGTSIVVVWGPRPRNCSIAFTRDKGRRVKAGLHGATCGPDFWRRL